MGWLDGRSNKYLQATVNTLHHLWSSRAVAAMLVHIPGHPALRAPLQGHNDNKKRCVRHRLSHHPSDKMPISTDTRRGLVEGTPSRRCRLLSHIPDALPCPWELTDPHGHQGGGVERASRDARNTVSGFQDKTHPTESHVCRKSKISFLSSSPPIRVNPSLATTHCPVGPWLAVAAEGHKASDLKRLMSHSQH